ncbi:universal stress protein [Cupriavidus sp. WKF15]|uniref:universal stress protein n=1 Tax=Cupriavidus sp. WKF15 TaxID=3032282 RepID=UPI0023E2F404|nr:universal stress protein [Cupriavidus sp. WKF15]WER50375.1 universal stress protein [Cupriavidus sp. WKF15]
MTTKTFSAWTGSPRRSVEAAGRCGHPHAVALLDKPVSKGRLAETILAQADQCNADLIVLGAHGRRGYLRVVVGSVAQAVVHQSRKPVLLVRSPAEY